MFLLNGKMLASRRARSRPVYSDTGCLIDLKALRKDYKTPAGDFPALKGIDLGIAPGVFAAVIGKSGSGKTTLINMLTGIDRPTSGEVWIGGTPLHALNEIELVEWRGKNVGIVFQSFQLLPSLTVAENIMFPMEFCEIGSPAERIDRAMSLLEQVGIPEQANKFPTEISGGQQQRVAIARALANDPILVVADEPTGNLDSKTAAAVFDLFRAFIEAGKTIIMVTHDETLANRVDRVLTLIDGQITHDSQHG